MKAAAKGWIKGSFEGLAIRLAVGKRNTTHYLFDCQGKVVLLGEEMGLGEEVLLAEEVR